MVKEALRISPGIYGKSLTPKADLKLQDFDFKEGTFVYPCSGVIGMSPNIWKNPTEFAPERFDSDSDGEEGLSEVSAFADG